MVLMAYLQPRAFTHCRESNKSVIEIIEDGALFQRLLPFKYSGLQRPASAAADFVTTGRMA
jgi:hypothetical protein